MNVRDIFSVIFAVLSVAIAVCALVAYHSEKEIGKSVSMLLVSLLPPVIGNFLIISSSTRLPAEVGCYMYYIGIDFTVYYLLRYAVEYCRIPWVTPRLHKIILTLFGIDILQLLANTIFHHAFDIEQIELYGEAYYRMIPYLPQNLHRALVYLVLLAVLVTFLVKVVHSSRIHARRYGLILGGLNDLYKERHTHRQLHKIH